MRKMPFKQGWPAACGPSAGSSVRPPARPRKAIAFDVDAASLASLREALIGWRIDSVCGATVAALPCDWNPAAVELLVVGVREEMDETLGLCRFLAYSSGYARDFRPEPVGPERRRDSKRRPKTPLLVLVPPGNERLVAAALDAGAHSCLLLPIHAGEVASMVMHARAGNQPGRHTLSLEGAQREDLWRDDGGES